MSRHTIRWKAALLLLPLLASCSMFSKPKTQGAPIDEAEDAVRDAERARVADYDAAGLRTAKRQLAIARALAADPTRKQLASWLASQTVVDAELAQARAQRARIFAYYDDLRQRVAPDAATPGAPTP